MPGREGNSRDGILNLIDHSGCEVTRNGVNRLGFRRAPFESFVVV